MKKIQYSVWILFFVVSLMFTLACSPMTPLQIALNATASAASSALSPSENKKDTPKEEKTVASETPIKEVDTDQTVIQKIGRPAAVINLDDKGTKQVFEYHIDDRLHLLAFLYNDEKKQMILKEHKKTDRPDAIQKFAVMKKDENQVRDYLMNVFPTLKTDISTTSTSSSPSPSLLKPTKF